MIEVKHLSKSYGPVAAVKDISFTVEKGHIYGFLGPNGAGKSTTMNMITGCLSATDGEITIDGHDIFEDAVEAKRHIGYLPEIPPLYTDMTPFEYLEFVGRAKGLRKHALYDQMEDVMKRTGITDVADRLIKNLSKGYRQRVGIAQAILGNPDVIILDEPTVGLDPIQIIEIRDLIKDLGREHTVILSSHILQEISAVCDYVIMISKGQIVASDTMKNLLSATDSVSVLRVETDGEETTVTGALKGIKEIRKTDISQQGGRLIVSIETDKGTDIGDTVFLALRKAELPVHSMTVGEQSSLEEVFIRLAGESLDAGAAYAAQQAEKKASKKKTNLPEDLPTSQSPLGCAYYTKEEAEAKEAANNTEDSEEYKPLFESEEKEEETK